MSKTSPVSNGILVQPSLFIRASRTARWPPALDGLSFSSSPCPFAVPLNAPCHRDASWTGHGGGQRARIGPCRDPREQDMGASEHVALESESREVVASLGPRLTPTPPVVFDVLMMRHDVLVAMAVSCVYLYFFSIFLSLVFCVLVPVKFCLATINLCM